MREITNDKLPKKIRTLLTERENLCLQGKFLKADQVREKIESQGYLVRDTKKGVKVLSDNNTKPAKNSFLVLFGSGETSPSGRKIHDWVFNKLGKKDISITIISSPAGFQPNVEVVYKEIADFFTKRFVNYHPKISIVFANNREQANKESVVGPILSSDYIFTGPGSPTYAVEHMKDTLLINTILERVAQGASLSLSSAAVIAFSHYSLPVYEIYKVGESPHWKKGLDVYSKLLMPLTIIPHYNNKEGGVKTDTSRCFMGKERFSSLLTKLPAEEKIWGIDEHTAIVVDNNTGKRKVLGKGKLHQVRRSG